MSQEPSEVTIARHSEQIKSLYKLFEIQSGQIAKDVADIKDSVQILFSEFRKGENDVEKHIDDSQKDLIKILDEKYDGRYASREELKRLVTAIKVAGGLISGAILVIGFLLQVTGAKIHIIPDKVPNHYGLDLDRRSP